jgi:hypothetical protein
MEINNQDAQTNNTCDVTPKKKIDNNNNNNNKKNKNNKIKCIKIDPLTLSILIHNKNNNIIQNFEIETTLETDGGETHVGAVENVDTSLSKKEPDTPRSAASSSSNQKTGYYYRHREQKIEYQKKYNRDQGDKIKNYNKDYYQKRREEILEKAKTKITCECGCEVQLFNMNSHKKTNKHSKALEKIHSLDLALQTQSAASAS